MQDIQFNAGAMIFSEGDVADNAYIVVSGKVDLLNYRQGSENKVGTVTAGDVLGDLAVFDNNALRPYTARALEATNLKAISPEDFSSLMQQCPENIKPFINFAFSKIKSTKNPQKIAQKLVVAGNITKLAISPASEKLNSQFQPMEITTAGLPFKIGGYPENGEKNRRDQLHLYIASAINPLAVSRIHCEIAIENERLVVNDLGSRFGTIVNGNRIGCGYGIYSADLQVGANEIILGNPDSNYKINVVCS